MAPNLLTFKGGVHPPQEKEATRSKNIFIPSLPTQAVIPLSQHTGKPAKPLVSPGDRVLTGQKIGEAQGFISANIHAPISGEVVAVKEHPHPLGIRTPSIVVQSDGEDRWIEKKGADWHNLSPQEIIERVKEAGIVGLGGAAFPTHVKLSPPKDKKVDTVILNGAECEPYLSCDHRLMVERSGEVVEGLKIIMRTVGVKRGIIGIEANKPDAVEKMKEVVQSEEGIEVKVLKAKYPQGAEKQLIKAILNREVPSGGLPFDVGVIVNNVGTVYAVREAVVEGKPLIERVVTVCGQVKKPGNLLLRIGTLFSEAIEFCGGLKEEADKLIMGGPMMGISQSTFDVPVIKGTSGILIIKESLKDQEYPCVRCARCVDVCPVNLLPTALARIGKFERWDLLSEYHVMDCIECGACAYICPSQIPIVHYVKVGKVMVRREQ